MQSGQHVPSSQVSPPVLFPGAAKAALAVLPVGQPVARQAAARGLRYHYLLTPFSDCVQGMNHLLDASFAAIFRDPLIRGVQKKTLVRFSRLACARNLYDIVIIGIKA
jgi:hypothetical protein